jgi:hypothetical protein
LVFFFRKFQFHEELPAQDPHFFGTGMPIFSGQPPMMDNPLNTEYELNSSPLSADTEGHAEIQAALQNTLLTSRGTEKLCKLGEIFHDQNNTTYIRK